MLVAGHHDHLHLPRWREPAAIGRRGYSRTLGLLMEWRSRGAAGDRQVAMSQSSELVT
jgi:hypothetical protein